MALESFLQDKIEKSFKFEPTDSQRELFKTLASFVTFEDSDILVINGYAGTGKTSAISAFVSSIKEFKMPYILMSPTGRSAKVLSAYSGEKAVTIHKQIYRQKSMGDGLGLFSLDINKHKSTFFIVDEASLISVSNNNAQSHFGSGDLLDDLVNYVRSGVDNKLIIIGDNAQLPPIGFDRSPALDINYLSKYGNVLFIELKDVVRQSLKSGILHNATILRESIEKGDDNLTPQLNIENFADIEKIRGDQLIETLNNAFEKYGIDDTVVLCRSNKRANRYNAGIRSAILCREERLCRGDKLMIVKNCYQFLDEIEELDFIANGDVAELLKIGKFEDRYGLEYAEAVFRFPDYNDVEITAKVILDTLESEAPALTNEQQRALYEGVYADYDNYKTKRKRISAVREDVYFNALQIKYASAITCHKSQGGQWSVVFIDNAFWGDNISLDDKKWLYTALTRAVKQVYLVNFSDKMFKNSNNL